MPCRLSRIINPTLEVLASALRHALAVAMLMLVPVSTWAGSLVSLTSLPLPDGRTLLAGGYGREGAQPFNYTWAVVRLNRDGSYDETFNGTGVATIPIYHYYEFAAVLALQPDGKILVAGSAADPVTQRDCYCGYVAVARLNADGTLDRSFNHSGKIVLALRDEWYPDALVIDPNGGIGLSDKKGVQFARLESDGSIDEYFVGPLGMAHEIGYRRVLVAEAYNATLDHYFVTWAPDEIEALQSQATIKGWALTGQTFQAYTLRTAGTSAVCRFYLPPSYGDSHFFGRDPAECAATAASHPAFLLESGAFMFLSSPANGVCPAETIPVYRLFNGRPDANHRYTTDRRIRDAMAAKGWTPEGDGADYVWMCAPQ